jgi:hypothetical protein
VSDIKVIDNLIDDEVFQTLQQHLMSTKVPWLYAQNVIGEEDVRCDPSYNFQLFLQIYKDFCPQTKAFEVMQPIIMHPQLNIRSIVNIKVNLNPKTETLVEHGFHTDVPFACTTAVYFLNTNNGYTLFKDGTKIESVANRIVTFPSSMEHSGTTCTDQKRRMVINFNYFAADRLKIPEYRNKYFGLYES